MRYAFLSLVIATTCLAGAGHEFYDLSSIEGRETHVLATNSNGVAVGFYTGTDNKHHAFKYDNGQFFSIFHESIESEATAVNELGDTVGTFSLSTGTLVHKQPFLLFNGLLRTFAGHFCGDCNITPLSVNIYGYVVGRIDWPDYKDSHAFLFNDVFVDLNTWHSTLIEASKIDDQGNIYGEYRVDSEVHQFVLHP